MNADEFDFPDDFATAGANEENVVLETRDALAHQITLLLSEQNAVDLFASRLARPPPPKVELSAVYVEDIKNALDVYNTQEKSEDLLPLLPASRLPASLLNSIYTTYHSPTYASYTHTPGDGVFAVHAACGARDVMRRYALLTGELPCVARVAEISDWLRSALAKTTLLFAEHSSPDAEPSVPISNLQSLQIALRVSFNRSLLEALLVVLIARRARARGILTDPSLTSSAFPAMSPSFSGQRSTGGIPLLAPPPPQEASAVVGDLAKATRALTTQESLPKQVRARKDTAHAPAPAITPARLREVADGALVPIMAFLSTLPRTHTPYGTFRGVQHLGGVADDTDAHASTMVDMTHHRSGREDNGIPSQDANKCEKIDGCMGMGLCRGVEGALVEMCVAALAEQRCETEKQCLDLLRHAVTTPVAVSSEECRAACADANASHMMQNSSSTSLPPPTWVPVCGGWVGDYDERFQLSLSLAGAVQHAIEEYCETEDAEAAIGSICAYGKYLHSHTCDKHRAVPSVGAHGAHGHTTGSIPIADASRVPNAETTGATAMTMASDECTRLRKALYRAELLAWRVDADGDEDMLTRLRAIETAEEEDDKIEEEKRIYPGK